MTQHQTREAMLDACRAREWTLLQDRDWLQAAKNTCVLCHCEVTADSSPSSHAQDHHPHAWRIVQAQMGSWCGLHTADLRRHLTECAAMLNVLLEPLTGINVHQWSTSPEAAGRELQDMFGNNMVPSLSTRMQEDRDSTDNKRKLAWESRGRPS